MSTVYTPLIFNYINDFITQAISDLKKKVSASRNLYISHIEDMENVVRLHKASANGSLEDISAKAVSNAHCVEEVSTDNTVAFLKISIKSKFYLFSVLAIG